MQTTEPTDSLEHGVGPPVSYTGMVRCLVWRCCESQPHTVASALRMLTLRQIRTCFRPSDDHATFSFNIPANAYAVVELRRLASLLSDLGQAGMSATASSIASVRWCAQHRVLPSE